MSKMFMNVKEVMEVLEVSESYAGKVDRKYFYEQFYGTRSNDGRN